MDDPQTWDRYTCVRNDPVDRIDPTGESFWGWFSEAMLLLSDVFTSGATTPEVVDFGISLQGIQALSTVAETARIGMATMPQGQSFQNQPQPQQGRINCPQWNPIITGVGPRQARGPAALSGHVPTNGQAAINPTDFGETDYYQLANEASADPSNKVGYAAYQKLMQEQKDLKTAHIVLSPRWGQATDPYGTANGTPAGLPSNGSLTVTDVYDKNHASPGHVDDYRYRTTARARAATRQVPTGVALTPTGNVRCPQ